MANLSSTTEAGFTPAEVLDDAKGEARAPMTMGYLIYGANGYTGEQIARMAVARGQRPVLAGRSAPAVGVLATELGLEWRAFALDDAAALDAALETVPLVLHCAGPSIVERATAGSAPPGFQTPSRAYGADFILEIPGTEREDL